MNLKDAFAGISAARTEEPKASSTQAPKHLSTEAPRRVRAEAPRAPLPLQGTAKSKHPDFEAVKIYVRSETRKRAWRKWEDAKGGDFSDLVEMLLQQYLSA